MRMKSWRRASPETKTRNDSVCGVLAVPRFFRLREGGGYMKLTTCTSLPVRPLTTGTSMYM